MASVAKRMVPPLPRHYTTAAHPRSSILLRHGPEVLPPSIAIRVQTTPNMALVQSRGRCHFGSHPPPPALRKLGAPLSMRTHRSPCCGYYYQCYYSTSTTTNAAATSTTTTSASRPSAELTADDYIQELQDLYDIAKDELEIATESTQASTIYAASDRITLREAFDDLERAYAAYTGTAPAGLSTASKATRAGKPSTGATAEADAGSAGVRLNAETEESAAQTGTDEERRLTNFDPRNIAPEIREEIKRRVGQRVREMRNAVQALEESAREE
ncbi:hypothetical protein VTO42DRAFT_4143 [Malbranchea cinnamomea]